MDKLVLIDGNSLLNRAYYATPVFTTRDGAPTNAVFGFTKLLFKILSDLKPQYILVAFDMKAPTFRHKMYDGYKANRKSMPDDLAVQLSPLKKLLKAMKIATCEKEGIEADDILGTLSAKFNVHSYIYTGDRDSYQLVNDKCDVHFTKKGVSDLLKLSAKNFKQETGLEPAQIIDLKALMGDKSDNIPGVPGIGEKTAYSLLEKYESLDGIYRNLDEIKGAAHEKFANNKELAYLSYKLATIDRNCDLNVELSDCVAPEKFGAEVKKMFAEFEFKSFLSFDIFEDGAPDKEIAYPEIIECTEYNQAQDILNSQVLAFVLGESKVQIYADGKLYVLRFAMNSLTDIIIPEDMLDKLVSEVFSEKARRVIVYDYKSILHYLAERGIKPQCDFDDLSVAKYLCDNSAADSLKSVCELNLYDYSYAAFALYELFGVYYARMNDEGLLNLYNQTEKPLIGVLWQMERDGVKISEARLSELGAHYKELIDRYKNKVFELCGAPFNLNSPAQLGEVLYNLGLTEVKKKSTGKYVTGVDVLEKLIDKHPAVEYVLKYRAFQKLNSTYIESFSNFIDKKTGLVHTTYNQTGTATGRLSSANPNLQNIPIRENEGRELRKVFVPRDGNVFIDADYSQIELRLLAHFSGCKELVKAYNEGADIHAATASQVFGVPVNEVTPQMRRGAKAVNFGIIYGISEFGLARNLDIPFSKAKEYIEKYFESYSAVKEYMNSNVEFARKNGYVVTFTGRKRFIPEINSSNYNTRQFGERAAMNMPLQGSSADIIKIAMINVSRALIKNNLSAKLILQVHDELVLEAPEAEAERAAQILKYEMENAVKLNVPLTVEVHTGKDWFEAK